MLSWQRTEGGLGASKFIFHWVAEDAVAAHVTHLICKEATEKVEKRFRRRINQGSIILPNTTSTLVLRLFLVNRRHGLFKPFRLTLLGEGQAVFGNGQRTNTQPPRLDSG